MLRIFRTLCQTQNSRLSELIVTPRVQSTHSCIYLGAKTLPKKCEETFPMLDTGAERDDYHNEQRNDTYYVPTFWYRDNDINMLNIKAVQQFGSVDRNQQKIDFLSVCPYNQNNPIFLQGLSMILRSAFERLEKTFSKEQSYRVVLPLNNEGKHWIGCILTINRSKKTVEFDLVDPLYQKINANKNMVASLQALFTGVIHNQETLGKAFIVKAAPEKSILRQRDGNSCGAFLVENLMRLIYGRSFTSGERPSANEIRHEHVKQLGPAFSHAQRANQLYVNINKLSNDLNEQFYVLCESIIENEDLNGNVTRLKENIKTWLEIALAIKDKKDIQANKQPSEALRVTLQEIFNGITSQMDVQTLYDNIENFELTSGIFAVLTLVYKEKQEADRLASADSSNTSATRNVAAPAASTTSSAAQQSRTSTSLQSLTREEIETKYLLGLNHDIQKQLREVHLPSVNKGIKIIITILGKGILQPGKNDIDINSVSLPILSLTLERIADSKTSASSTATATVVSRTEWHSNIFPVFGELQINVVTGINFQLLETREVNEKQGKVVLGLFGALKSKQTTTPFFDVTYPTQDKAPSLETVYEVLPKKPASTGCGQQNNVAGIDDKEALLMIQAENRFFIQVRALIKMLHEKSSLFSFDSKNSSQVSGAGVSHFKKASDTAMKVFFEKTP